MKKSRAELLRRAAGTPVPMLLAAMQAGQASAEPKRMGRPPKPESERHTERFEVRCTKAQRAKLDRLGGQVWLRERIDKAKEPM
jgi:hypothetical protein